MKPSTYCKNCGAYIPDGKKKCLACGFPIITPPLISKEDEEWFKEHKHLFKPIDGYAEQRRFSWNGYEINENGQVLSIPDNDEDDIPTTSLYDKTFQVIKTRDKYAKTVFNDDYYEQTLNLANEALKEIKKLEPKQQESKPDIDLDDLMEKTFFTVKHGAEISKYYFADSPRITRFPMNDLEYGRTIDGRIISGSTGGVKHVIDLKLIEK